MDFNISMTSASDGCGGGGWQRRSWRARVASGGGGGWDGAGGWGSSGPDIWYEVVKGVEPLARRTAAM
jgi:hypothetical protein